MAAVAAVHAVCAGIAQHLTRAHQLSPIKDVSCVFDAVGTSALKKLDGKTTTCSVWLWRISHNEHTRNAAGAPRAPLSVNLHLLLTAWADSASDEQTVLAWAMTELHRHPVLDRSLLGRAGRFDDADRVQLIPEELTLEDASKLWQLLSMPYRLSVGYVARNVRIDVDDEPAEAPVVATRLGVGDAAEPAR